MKPLTFIDEHGSFTMKNPENTSYLYFPLASENGLKSAVTPNLGARMKASCPPGLCGIPSGASPNLFS